MLMRKAAGRDTMFTAPLSKEDEMVLAVVAIVSVGLIVAWLIGEWCVRKCRRLDRSAFSLDIEREP